MPLASWPGRGAIAAVLGVALFGSLSCSKDSTGAAFGVARYIARIASAANPSLVAQLVSGQPPAAGSGPSVTVSGAGAVINGGSAQFDLSAGSGFTTVVVYVEGQTDFYQLTLPGSVTSAGLILTMAANAPIGAFNAKFGVGAGVSSLGTFQTAAVNVIQVGSGDIQVSVSWDVNSDVDLHVVEPSGTEIYWGSPSSASGGELDLDSNAACNIDGVRNENITWPTATPPSGTYTVRVDYWDSCAVSQTNWVVTVQVQGKAPQTFSGSFTGLGDAGGAGSGVQVTQFSFP